MKISLSEHFSYKKLLRFTLPSVAMMIFTSIYGVVDGLFVSNIVGEDAFTAVNFIMPVLMIFGTVGFMFGTGGSALVAKTLGEGKKEKANSIFSLILYASIAVGVVLAAAGFIFMEKIAAAMGAKEEMLSYCTLYGRIIVAAIPFFILQMEFQNLCITAEKPKLNFTVTVISGVANMALDALFVAVFRWGVAGAAAATAFSQMLGGIIPLIYFVRPNSSLLRLGKAAVDFRALIKVCSNGMSELVSQGSMSLVNMLYNYQLMKYIGKSGVAGELKSLRQKSVVIIGAASAAMLIFSQLSARLLGGIFVGYNQELLDLTVNGFRIFAVSFLFAGFNIFGSSFFTALNNGGVSAAISFLRTVVFQVGALLLLPLIFKADGIWASVTAAEALAFVITLSFFAGKRKKYGY